MISRVILILILFFKSNLVFAKNLSDDQVLSDLSSYMEKMKTAEGRFIQIGPDGVISEGEFALKRPGKIYFDYAPPTPLRIISDGFWVAVEDKKIKTIDRYPLSETPLKILLDKKPDFLGNEYSISLKINNNSYIVSAYDPDIPDQGSVALVFSSNPIALRQWIVTDVQGLETIVSLQDVIVNAPADNKLFYIDNEIKQRHH